jgi:hypothetical protein
MIKIYMNTPPTSTGFLRAPKSIVAKYGFPLQKTRSPAPRRHREHGGNPQKIIIDYYLIVI